MVCLCSFICMIYLNDTGGDKNNGDDSKRQAWYQGPAMIFYMHVTST